MDFLSDADPAQTCRVISAPQLDRARNVQFRHFLIDSERREVELTLSKCLVFPTSAWFINLFMWSTAMMLKLPVEKTKMPISDTTDPVSGETDTDK